MSEERYDYSESFGSFSEFSNESLNQLIISGENQKPCNNWTKFDGEYINLFDKINDMDNPELNFKSSQTWNEANPKSELYWVMDELVNKNLPDVFRDTTTFVRDESTHQICETMVLSGFYKNVVLNEIKHLMTSSEYDNETTNSQQDISEEDEQIMWNSVNLPKPQSLAELTQGQRNLISNTYKLLRDSNLAYNKLLKYCIPAQFADLEAEKKSIIGKKRDISDKNESKLEMFKPPRIIFFNGFEYYFNCMTGIWNQNLNYRCRDYKWKGSIKLQSLNPF